MILSPNINTDEKMPKDMMHALNRHEAICAVTGVKSVTDKQVREFLKKEYGGKFASKFKPSYLFNIR